MTRKRWSRLAALSAAIVVAVGLPGAASGWAGATHAYIAKHTDYKAGQTDANELCNRIYGANAADLFNLDYSETGIRLAAILHGQGNATAAEAWGIAADYPSPTDAQLAFAYGLATHNDAWGTDSTAHFAGITTARELGYVEAKALAFARDPPPEILLMGITDFELRRFIGHAITEFAVDLVLADADPGLGFAQVQAASLGPAPYYACPELAGPEVMIDLLYTRVLPIVGPDHALEVILMGDGFNRQVMFAEGSALAQPTPEARLQAVAGLLTMLAPRLLGPDLPPTEVLHGLIASMLRGARDANAVDALQEIEATIGRVNARMNVLVLR